MRGRGLNVTGPRKLMASAPAWALVLVTLSGCGSSGKPASTSVSLPAPAAASQTSRQETSAIYTTVLSRLSGTFDKASSQFMALAEGAVLAEAGAEAPTFAAAAASYDRSLSALHPPARSAAGLSELESQLTRLSLELTKLADDTQSGDLSGATAELSAASKTDARIAVLEAGLRA